MEIITALMDVMVPAMTFFIYSIVPVWVIGMVPYAVFKARRQKKQALREENKEAP